MELPILLRQAIETELESKSTGKLATLVNEISESYRSGVPLNKGRFIRSHEDVIAYAAYRLPATYAAVFSSLSQVNERYPNYTPKTLLDVGAGPGTATWAALNIWNAIEKITLLEQEEFMIQFGKRLASYSELNSFINADWKKADITKSIEVAPHDLVIASYVFNELSPEKHEKFINDLWNCTKDLLMIIEPGTPAGFQRLKSAREQLIKLGAKTVAPCPHDLPCPLETSDWCHFTKRVARTKLHRSVKSGELSYEDEKFSFLCMSRSEVKPIKGLVIRHPQIHKGHIKLNLCTKTGILNTTVTKKDKEAYRNTRDLEWGSILHEDIK